MNPKWSPPRRIPIPVPSPRFHATTRIPKPETVTPSPTSSGLDKIPQKEETTNVTLQNKFAGSSDIYNYPVFSTENSFHQNTTSWPFPSSLSTEIIKHAEKVSKSETVSTVGDELQNSEDTPVSSFTNSPEITSSYDYLTEESDDVDGSTEGSEKPTDFLHSTEHNLEIRTRSTMLDTNSPVLQNGDVTSHLPPLSHPQEPSMPLPDGRAAQGLTTASTISLQVDVPIREVTTQEASVTVVPTTFGKVWRGQADSRTEVKLPDIVTSSTQLLVNKHALKNRMETSERIVMNVTESSLLTISNSLPGDAYWIIGNWSEVCYF